MFEAKCALKSFTPGTTSANAASYSAKFGNVRSLITSKAVNFHIDTPFNLVRGNYPDYFIQSLRSQLSMEYKKYCSRFC
ncbi:hypothetical protein BB559_007119 [Furculomyces boomerangus]|uniref:Uncharacterized protein n=1 Tax=Furculomyces boomerangus TaxID=61424 RepID=A0A2T9XYV6_9FUNG|nr:hypothetical protein BB559_007119 [Furculomyces boomerangus]